MVSIATIKDNALHYIAVDDKKRIRSEAQEWYFRLMNDPEQFEKWIYIDSINVYNGVIEEFQNYMSRHLQQIVLHVLGS